MRSQHSLQILAFCLFAPLSLLSQNFKTKVDFGGNETFQNLSKTIVLQPASSLETIPVNNSIVGESAQFLEINASGILELLQYRNNYEAIEIELTDRTYELWLVPSPTIKPGSITDIFNQSELTNVLNDMQFFWGVVAGFENSFVSIAISQDEVIAFIHVNGEDFTIGKMKDLPVHILYRNSDLIPVMEGGCHTDDSDFLTQTYENVISEVNSTNRNEDNCVNMYVEIDYPFLLQSGSINNAVFYVLGSYNQAAIIYANEQINISVAQIGVWTAPSIYTGPTNILYRNQFKNALNGVFNGDLAQLVGTGGGGAAFISPLCYKLNAVAYVGLYTAYQNYPVFSWSVQILTHEIGHNLGSPHTHNCFWNGPGNPAIDGCGPSAGYQEGCDGPIPASGTIMSYCGFTSAGVDFSLGFGQMPGDLIRSVVHNSDCLADCRSLGDCHPPHNIQVEFVSATQALVSWSGPLPATLWDIEYGMLGFTPSGTPMISGVTSPVLISGLNSELEYTFYIRSDCGEGNYSEWNSNPAICNTPVAAGVLSVSPNPTVTNDMVWLSLSGHEGNIERFEYSFNNFSTISGTLNADVNPKYFFATVVNPITWFRAVVSDMNCPDGYSTTATLALNCAPFYTYGPSDGDYISNVSFNTINNTSTSDLETDAYQNFKHIETTVCAGSSYPLNVSGTFTFGAYQGFAAWVDWNGDGQFSVNENVLISSPVATATTNITIPTDAVSGPVTMRVLCVWNFTPSAIACPGNDYEYGEVEEYTIIIQHPQDSVINVETCDSFELNNTTYTESGMYFQNETDEFGCTSTITINLTILGETDDCGNCITGGISNPAWNQNCTDCFGTPNGTAFLDNCSTCVGGNTGLSACTADCNGDFGGTAFLDNCNECVGGNTGIEACAVDCNGDFGGTAFLDNCNTCVGGNTGLSACTADCNGDFGGTAFIDNCNTCVGGNTGLSACTADCNGDFGGTAFLDNCNTCVGGNTGFEPCAADCNGDFGGTAFLDNCNTCVGGNTGVEACAVDCNDDFGGTAFLDNCNTCVGGNTGLSACTADCNGDFGGTAFLDNCNTCVGGNTGLEPCAGDIPLTQVQAQFCGGVYDLFQVIICENTVPGAQNYRWELTPVGGSPLPEYTRGYANRNLRLGWITSISMGETYEVRVKAMVDGVWGNYGPMCTVTTTPSVAFTQLMANYSPLNPSNNSSYVLCNNILADYIYQAERFEWELTGPNTLIAESPSYFIQLGSIPGIQMNTIYNVRVRARINGQWGAFGVQLPIQIGTPSNTQIIASQCGTIRQMNQAVAAINACGAQQYTFRFQHNTEPERIAVRTAYTCPLWLVGAPLTPGETYSVTVKVTQGGIEGDFSTACNITIAGPQTEGLLDDMINVKSLETGSMSLFPNPNFGGEVRLQMESIEEGAHQVNITVYDIFGKQISTEAFGYEGTELSHVLRFNSQLAAGIYTVHVVIDGNSFAVQRMVVK